MLGDPTPTDGIGLIVRRQSRLSYYAIRCSTCPAANPSAEVASALEKISRVGAGDA